MRHLLTLVQPCILDEQPLEYWDVYRDDVTGEERIDKRDAGHDCPTMRALLRERHPRR